MKCFLRTLLLFLVAAGPRSSLAELSCVVKDGQFSIREASPATGDIACTYSCKCMQCRLSREKPRVLRTGHPLRHKRARRETNEDPQRQGKATTFLGNISFPPAPFFVRPRIYALLQLMAAR